MNRFYAYLSSSILVWLMAVNSCVHAQRSDFQSWTSVGLLIPIDSNQRWSLSSEVQPRLGKNLQHLERVLILTSVSHAISQSADISFGHGWTPGYMNSSYEGDFRNENRTFQALSIKHTLGGVSMRYRLLEEQRYIQDASGVSNRLRLLIGGTIRLMQKSDAGLAWWNDYFINLHSVSRGPKAGFDRDRFFLGSYLNRDNVRYEVGYLGEFGAHFGADDRMINAVMFGIRFRV